MFSTSANKYPIEFYYGSIKSMTFDLNIYGWKDGMPLMRKSIEVRERIRNLKIHADLIKIRWKKGTDGELGCRLEGYLVFNKSSERENLHLERVAQGHCVNDWRNMALCILDSSRPFCL